MKSLRTVRYSLLAAAVAGAAVVSTPAAAEVSATAAVANMYLWRGQNLGGGTPVVSGSLDYSHDSGLFAGVWGSSGDTLNGNETDLYVGYGFSGDSFGVKVTFYDYTYARSTTTGDLQEVVLGVTAGGFFADAIIGVSDFEDANYFDVGYTKDKFTGKLGTMMIDDSICGAAPAFGCDYTHLDLSYAYNGNLSFTVSSVVDADEGSAVYNQEDPLFVVSYSLPLDLK